MTRRPLVATLAIAAIVGVAGGLPLAWMLWQIATRPEVWVELRPTAFRLDLLARTVAYNLAAALIATGLALPAAVVLGRGRGVVATLLWVALPVSLFIPSIVYTYGWMQCLRLLGIVPDFQSPADVLRCVWSLATWLTPLPAFLIGLALRNVDADLQQQALLDGRLWRVTLRQLVGPIVVSVLACTVLAVQEFSVYEPTGISVIATEVRMVFDTGAMSGAENAMTDSVASFARETGDGTDPARAQQSRAAAAIATAVPMLLLIAACGFASARIVKRVSAADAIDAGAWPRVLDAGSAAKAQAILVLGLTVVIPLVSMVQSLAVPIDPVGIWREFSTPVLGTLLVGLITGAAALGLAVAATAGRSKIALAVALTTFLVGGQLLAIALIRLYNRPATMALYDSAAVAVFAYIARFGWIALIAGRFTMSTRWRELREMAAVDGASAGQVALRVILPLAWPILLAAALCAMTLAMAEVPATVLLAPMRPPMLIPEMMTMVHILRYDPMIQASLLLAAVVMVLAVGIVVLTYVGARGSMFRRGETR